MKEIDSEDWADAEQLAFLEIVRRPAHLRLEGLRKHGLEPARFMAWCNQLESCLQEENLEQETPGRGEITRLLDAWSAGEKEALAHLIALAEPELRKIAARYFRREAPDHTLQPTALVSELYLKLHDQRKVQWHGRAEFFGVAARMIHNFLVDYARKRQAKKRGADAIRIPLEDEKLPLSEDPNVLAVDDALKALAKLDPGKSEILQLWIFGGLTIEEIAAVKGVSRSTIKREMEVAKLFLRRELDPEGEKRQEEEQRSEEEDEQGRSEEK